METEKCTASHGEENRGSELVVEVTETVFKFFSVEDVMDGIKQHLSLDMLPSSFHRPDGPRMFIVTTLDRSTTFVFLAEERESSLKRVAIRELNESTVRER